MNEFVQEKYGSFLKDSKKITYTLNENQLFSMNQYKICNNQTKDLFVKCQKVQHNGKVRILYFVEEYENILDSVKKVNECDYYRICKNLIHAMTQIKDNGFLDIYNVVVKTDMIYVEKETLKVKLIYTPIVTGRERVVDIDNVIKEILIEITDKNFYSELLDMMKGSSLEQLQRWFEKKDSIKEKSNQQSTNDNEEESFEVECDPQVEKIKEETDTLKIKDKKNWIVPGIIGITLLFGVMCYAIGAKSENEIIENPKPTMIPTLTATATSTPTPTPTLAPTATPTLEPTPTQTPTPTQKPKIKRKVVENTPVPENSKQDSYVPPQTQQNVPASVEQESNQEQPTADSDEAWDEIIIVQ